MVFAGGPGALSTAEAASAGTISLVPATAAPGTAVTVTVVDPDLSVMTSRAGETTGAGGVPHELPAGVSGTTYVFYLAFTPIADASGNGQVGPEDVEVSLTGAVVANLSAGSGLVTLVRMADNGSAAPFSVTYSSDQADLATVRVTSDADGTGFDLALAETGVASGEFTATVVVGDDTSATNALSPSATTRPVIAGADGGLVSASYSDASPLRVVSDAALVDGVAPAVVGLAPAHEAGLRTVTPWAVAQVTDFGSSLGLDSIVFHVDVDRDGVFDEAGEAVSPSSQESEAIRGGFVAMALLPNMGADGPTEWYVTATDGAGNVGRSDADALEDGDQNHLVYVDTNAPSLLSATAGEAYDLDEEEVLTGQRDSVRAVFSEELDAGTVQAGLFVVDGFRATSADVFEEFPDTVWLTVPGLPSRATLLEAAVGAVKDTAGHDSAPGQTWPVDGVPPRLQVSTDRAATQGPVSVTVASDEDLIVGPMITFNNVTVGRAGQVDLLRWVLVLDAGSLGGTVAADGVKNVEVSAFDVAGNVAHGGVDSGEAAYPAGATRFELDRALGTPVMTPTYGAAVTVHDPAIEASYAGEAAEYEGDSLVAVTPVVATLDGEDVLADLTSADGAIWGLETWGLGRGWHTFTVRATDLAGNTHSPVVVRFNVDADIPTPTPTPTPTATPAPTATPTPEPIDAAGPEATPTPTPTATPAPTATPTPDGTAGSTDTDAPTPEPGDVPGPEATPTPGGTAGFTDMNAATPGPSGVPGPEATPIPEPAPEAEAGPAATPEPEPLPTPAPDAAPDAAEEVPEAETGPAASDEGPAPGAQPEESTETEAPESAAPEEWETEAEIEATVQAIRAEALADVAGEEAGEGGSGGWSENGAGAAGADFILYGAGLVGLLIAAGRRRLHGVPE